MPTSTRIKYTCFGIYNQCANIKIYLRYTNFFCEIRYIFFLEYGLELYAQILVFLYSFFECDLVLFADRFC